MEEIPVMPEDDVWGGRTRKVPAVLKKQIVSRTAEVAAVKEDGCVEDTQVVPKDDRQGRKDRRG